MLTFLVHPLGSRTRPWRLHGILVWPLLLREYPFAFSLVPSGSRAHSSRSRDRLSPVPRFQSLLATLKFNDISVKLIHFLSLELKKQKNKKQLQQQLKTTQDFSYLLHPFSLNFPDYPCILIFHPANLKNSDTIGSNIESIFRRPSLIKMGSIHTMERKLKECLIPVLQVK